MIVISKLRWLVVDFDLVQSSSNSSEKNLSLLYAVLAWVEMACYMCGFFYSAVSGVQKETWK